MQIQKEISKNLLWKLHQSANTLHLPINALTITLLKPHDHCIFTVAMTTISKPSTVPQANNRSRRAASAHCYHPHWAAQSRPTSNPISKLHRPRENLPNRQTHYWPASRTSLPISSSRASIAFRTAAPRTTTSSTEADRSTEADPFLLETGPTQTASKHALSL